MANIFLENFLSKLVFFMYCFGEKRLQTWDFMLPETIDIFYRIQNDDISLIVTQKEVLLACIMSN